MTVEELQEQLLQEQENSQKLKAEIESLQSKNDELVETNARLTDYNNKLFMRVSETEEEPKKDLTADELEAQEIDKIREIMKERRI